MDYLKRQTTYIAEQLGSMSRLQRLLVAMLVLVFLGGFYEMMQWASQPEWMPLLDQPLKPEELQRIQSELAMMGVESRVEADRVLMRGGDDDRQRAHAVLAQRGALPRDTSLSYKALIEQSSHFISNQESAWRHDRGLETELSSVLSRFQHVREASVFIEKPRKRGLGRRSDARASVHLTVDSDAALDNKQVAAIAHFVAGAIDGLDPADVKITDGLRFYHPPDPTGQIPLSLLEQQRAHEEWYTRKIYDQLSYIHGLVVNVHARLRDAESRVETKKLGKPSVQKETTESRESKSAAHAAGPGVLPNQSRAITEAGLSPSTTEEKTTVEMSADRDVEHTVQNKPAGHLDELWASISVPHRYIENHVRNEQAIDPETVVTHSQLIAAAPQVLDRLRTQVKTLIGAAEDEQVAVDWYYDKPITSDALAASQAPDFVALAENYAPQAVLGFLALLSLIAVMRVAKKAQASITSTKDTVRRAASATIGAGRDAMQLASLGGGPVTVGEAEGIHSALVGHEVDEGLVRTQQIVEQIGQLVKEDPESAAGIVQNWLQDEK